MKLKKYLDVYIYDGKVLKLHNPLKLSEAHFISQMAQNNEDCTIHVSLEYCTENRYNLMFNGDIRQDERGKNIIHYKG